MNNSYEKEISESTLNILKAVKQGVDKAISEGIGCGEIKDIIIEDRSDQFIPANPNSHYCDIYLKSFKVSSIKTKEGES